MRRTFLAMTTVISTGCGGTVATATTAASDAGTDRVTPVATQSCAIAQVTWGYDGGLGPSYVESSTVTDCNAYTHNRTATSSSPALSCTEDVPAQGRDGITQAILTSALSDPDVAAAVAGSTQLYGSDPRGCDGALLRITIGQRTFDVGGDCSTANCGPMASPCVPTSPGLATLVGVLTKLDTQELSFNPCASVFP